MARRNLPALAEWLMSGTQVIGDGVIGVIGAGWSVAGTSDFNGDGKADILFQHDTAGVPDAVAERIMNGAQVIGGG